MHILILTKKDNIKELTDYIKCNVMIDSEKISKDFADITYDNDTIRIRKFSEQGCIGKRCKIILYDGDFTQEEIETILKPMNIDILVDFDGRTPETLLAPIGMLSYLLRYDLTYIITDGQRDSESIQYVTKDIIKACNRLRDDKNHNIYCHQDDTDDGELWWYEICCNIYEKYTIDDYIEIDFKELR